jgi:hypothetical protein
MADSMQSVEKIQNVKGSTVFSFNLPTPMWATWIFRTEFVLSKAATMYLTGTHHYPAEKTTEVLLIMSIVDFVVWFIARGLGVKKTDIESELQT